MQIPLKCKNRPQSPFLINFTNFSHLFGSIQKTESCILFLRQASTCSVIRYWFRFLSQQQKENVFLKSKEQKKHFASSSIVYAKTAGNKAQCQRFQTNNKKLTPTDFGGISVFRMVLIQNVQLVLEGRAFLLLLLRGCPVSLAFYVSRATSCSAVCSSSQKN